MKYQYRWHYAILICIVVFCVGDKFINVKHKDSFQSLNDAELKAIELSEYHCSHLNLDHSSIVHHNDRVASIVFVTK